jgi:hypothetical protein
LRQRRRLLLQRWRLQHGAAYRRDERRRRSRIGEHQPTRSAARVVSGHPRAASGEVPRATAAGVSPASKADISRAASGDIGRAAAEDLSRARGGDVASGSGHPPCAPRRSSEPSTPSASRPIFPCTSTPRAHRPRVFPPAPLRPASAAPRRSTNLISRARPGKATRRALGREAALATTPGRPTRGAFAPRRGGAATERLKKINPCPH